MSLYRVSIVDIYCRLSVTNILYFDLVQVFFVLDNTLILLFIILLDSVDVTAVLAIFMTYTTGEAGYAYLLRTADIFAILHRFNIKTL